MGGISTPRPDRWRRILSATVQLGGVAVVAALHPITPASVAAHWVAIAAGALLGLGITALDRRGLNPLRPVDTVGRLLAIGLLGGAVGVMSDVAPAMTAHALLGVVFVGVPAELFQLREGAEDRCPNPSA